MAEHKRTKQQQDIEDGACKVMGTSEAGKASKCQGCAKQGSCSSGAAALATTTAPKDTLISDADVKAGVSARMDKIAHKILVLSGKGGVGKSMIASQIAFNLAERGFEVGLVDVDICGPSAPKMAGARRDARVEVTADGVLIPVQVKERLCVMSMGFMLEDDAQATIWRGPKKNGLIQKFLKDVDWGELDYLVVDTPPGTSDEHMSTVEMLKGNLRPGDGAILVTSPQDVSVSAVAKEIDFCRRVGLAMIGVVENFAEFVCPHCSKGTRVWKETAEYGGGRGLAERSGVPFLCVVPLDPKLAAAGDCGRIVDVGSPAADAISGLCASIVAFDVEGEPVTIDADVPPKACDKK
jgi:Mrp family chromosome partitioning ATPase